MNGSYSIFSVKKTEGQTAAFELNNKQFHNFFLSYFQHECHFCLFVLFPGAWNLQAATLVIPSTDSLHSSYAHIIKIMHPFFGIRR
jgi:hypothetical protein